MAKGIFEKVGDWWKNRDSKKPEVNEKEDTELKPLLSSSNSQESSDSRSGSEQDSSGSESGSENDEMDFLTQQPNKKAKEIKTPFRERAKKKSVETQNEVRVKNQEPKLTQEIKKPPKKTDAEQLNLPPDVFSLMTDPSQPPPNVLPKFDPLPNLNFFDGDQPVSRRNQDKKSKKIEIDDNSKIQLIPQYEAGNNGTTRLHLSINAALGERGKIALDLDAGDTWETVKRKIQDNYRIPLEIVDNDGAPVPDNQVFAADHLSSIQIFTPISKEQFNSLSRIQSSQRDDVPVISQMKITVKRKQPPNPVGSSSPPPPSASSENNPDDKKQELSDSGEDSGDVYRHVQGKKVRLSSTDYSSNEEEEETLSVSRIESNASKPQQSLDSDDPLAPDIDLSNSDIDDPDVDLSSAPDGTLSYSDTVAISKDNRQILEAEEFNKNILDDTEELLKSTESFTVPSKARSQPAIQTLEMTTEALDIYFSIPGNSEELSVKVSTGNDTWGDVKQKIFEASNKKLPSTAQTIMIERIIPATEIPQSASDIAFATSNETILGTAKPEIPSDKTWVTSDDIANAALTLQTPVLHTTDRNTNTVTLRMTAGDRKNTINIKSDAQRTWGEVKQRIFDKHGLSVNAYNHKEKRAVRDDELFAVNNNISIFNYTALSTTPRPSQAIQAEQNVALNSDSILNSDNEWKNEESDDEDEVVETVISSESENDPNSEGIVVTEIPADPAPAPAPPPFTIPVSRNNLSFNNNDELEEKKEQIVITEIASTAPVPPATINENHNNAGVDDDHKKEKAEDEDEINEIGNEEVGMKTQHYISHPIIPVAANAQALKNRERAFSGTEDVTFTGQIWNKNREPRGEEASKFLASSSAPSHSTDNNADKNAFFDFMDEPESEIAAEFILTSEEIDKFNGKKDAPNSRDNLKRAAIDMAREAFQVWEKDPDFVIDIEANDALTQKLAVYAIAALGEWGVPAKNIEVNSQPLGQEKMQIKKLGKNLTERVEETIRTQATRQEPAEKNPPPRPF